MTRSRIVSAVGVALLLASAVPAVMSADPAPAVSQAPARNANAALRTTISELNVDNVPLSRVVDFLRDVSGANITVNWKVLEGAGIAKDSPISIQVRDLTLRKMLRLVLDQASPNSSLVFSVDSNVIEVTTQDEADHHMITKVYVVDDLVMTDNSGPITPPVMNLQQLTTNGQTAGGGGGGTVAGGGGQGLFTETTTATTVTDTPQKRGEDLAALIREVVRPNIWRENGGTASIRYFSGKLIVTAPVSVHEAIGGPVAPEGGQRLGM